MKLRKIMDLPLAILTSVLTSCASTGSDTSSEPPDTEAESSIITYVGTTVFDGSLDPVKGAMSYGYSFTNAALIKVNPNSEYIGDMATDWTISPDALVYTYSTSERM
jgi:peptide/nickel transport system substrate-binding protein